LIAKVEEEGEKEEEEEEKACFDLR